MPALDEIPGYSMNNKGQKRIIKIVESKLVVEEIPERESEKPNIKAEEKVEEKKDNRTLILVVSLARYSTYLHIHT